MKLLGKLTITVDGNKLHIDPKPKIDTGGIERELVGGEGDHTEKDTPGTVECTVRYSKDTSLKSLRAIDDATVRVVTDTGQVYIGAHWVCLKAQELGDEGATVSFGGAEMQEVKANG